MVVVGQLALASSLALALALTGVLDTGTSEVIALPSALPPSLHLSHIHTLSLSLPLSAYFCSAPFLQLHCLLPTYATTRPNAAQRLGPAGQPVRHRPGSRTRACSSTDSIRSNPIQPSTTAATATATTTTTTTTTATDTITTTICTVACMSCCSFTSIPIRGVGLSARELSKEHAGYLPGYTKV
ncbi:hypothetical protein K431DRAFT_7552 [Polychaeton citri CBS 116435]|uniref:Uncharacterized protein n=1 Tax=Polychaeton citri CBS 116435 TaxID=1314669 RepID=A0A9P4USH6_9PEZI|nr:hypothetical protein K431DRAFT_7552 [Polychaeton citri CBS 116435]